MSDVIAYTIFVLYILAQILIGVFFLVWTIKIGAWFLGAMLATILGLNCFIGVYSDITKEKV